MNCHMKTRISSDEFDEINAIHLLQRD